MIEKYISTIKKSPLFYGIKDEEIISMLQCLVPNIYSYNKNEYIITVGEIINKFGIILEGEAIIIKESAAGNRIIMSIIKRGDLFGEMLVFSEHKVWPVSVTVQSPCRVLFLKNSDLIVRCKKMCPWHTSMIKNFMKVLSDKALILNKKVEYLSIKSIRGKICTYLLDQYKNTRNINITLPLKRNELADFLNVSRPSMSREMCQMRDEGLIDFYMSSFKLKDIESLKKFCN